MTREVRMMSALAAELLDSFQGEVITPEVSSYAAARTIWNAAFDHYPALIARCTSTQDVAAAVRLARKQELSIAVRSGGHSHAGHSTCDDGMVIDLSTMKRVTVDAERRMAVLQPGVTWGELGDVAETHGLAAVGGHVSAVGVAGLVLGGGIGWLARTHGLACDNLLDAQVVTADGEVIHADDADKSELIWGLRGGGGNFGIVTELSLRLHPTEPLLGGVLMYRGDRAREALRLFRDHDATAPEAVTMVAGLITAPLEPYVPEDMHGKMAVLLACCYAGPADQGWQQLARLREVVPPAVDLIEPMSYRRLQHLFDPMVPSNIGLVMRSGLLGPLDDAALDSLIGHASAMPSPMSNILLTPLGGAVNAVARDATAFPHRDARYNIEIGAALPTPDVNIEPFRRWADTCLRSVHSVSRGVHANHLADEGGDRVREAYAENYPRLATLKAVHDPDNIFRLNHNIEPAS